MISRERLQPIDTDGLLERALLTHNSAHRTNRCGLALSRILGQLVDRVEDTFGVIQFFPDSMSLEDAFALSGLTLSAPHTFRELAAGQPKDEFLTTSAASFKPVLFTSVMSMTFNALSPGGRYHNEQSGIFLEMIMYEDALKGIEAAPRTVAYLDEVQAYAGF